MYTKQDVLLFVQEENVKFIRLTYFDVFGVQKNVSILPNRLPTAFDKGIAIDTTAVAGFANPVHSDLFIKPDPSTFTVMPWRSMDGNVVFMICDIYYPDGKVFEWDSRYILKQTIEKAQKYGLDPEMAAKFEFYLFYASEDGSKLNQPIDKAGYMDIAPLDKGENVRRDICLTLEEMGLTPLKSFHQEGPGQNEIDFHFADALRAADEASIFKWVVKNTASLNGYYADFSPVPMDGFPGNGMHIQLRFFDYNPTLQNQFAAGVLKYIKESSLFMLPSVRSYDRPGKFKAPDQTDWSMKTRFVLLRFPALNPDTIEIRSADALSNPYLAFSIIIAAGLKGIEQKLALPNKAEALPASLEEARKLAMESGFIQELIPQGVLDEYLEREAA